MRKFIITLFLLTVAISCIHALGYITNWTLCHVIVLKKNQTVTIGYIRLSPIWEEGDNEYTHYYNLGKVDKGTDILPIIRQKKALQDSVIIETNLIQTNELNMVVESGRKILKVPDISKIILLEDVDGDFYGKGIYHVNYGAVISDKDYALINDKIYATVCVNDVDYFAFCLVSGNADYTQLDLYLYACLMSKRDDLGEIGCHPFMSEMESTEFNSRTLVDYLCYKKTEKYSAIIDVLSRCKESWLVMAKYLEQSQTILPEARAEAIDTLKVLSGQCEANLNMIKQIQNTGEFPSDEKEADIPYNSILKCVNPNLSFPSKEGINWKSYLRKRNIISFDLACD